jgi:hypothetical protein
MTKVEMPALSGELDPVDSTDRIDGTSQLNQLSGNFRELTWEA